MNNVGLFYDHLVCIVCGHLVYFFPFWYVWTMKNLATLCCYSVRPSKLHVSFLFQCTLKYSVQERTRAARAIRTRGLLAPLHSDILLRHLVAGNQDPILPL
jgi:hypothetical protein